MNGAVSLIWSQFTPSLRYALFLLASYTSDCITPRAASAQEISAFIRSGLEHSPAVQSARIGIDVQREGLIQARSAYLPRVSVEAGISTTNRDARLQDGTSFSDTTNPTNAVIAAEQTLYSNGVRDLSFQYASLQQRIAQLEYNARELDVAREIASACFDAWYASVRLIEYSNLEQLLYEQLLIAQGRFESGVGTNTEVAQVTARLSEARAQLAASQSNQELANYRLATLSGLEITDEIEVPTDITLKQATVEELTALAERYSPRIKVLEVQHRSERLSAISSLRQNGPQLTARLSGSLSRETSPAVDADDDFRASLVFSMPLYDGGRARSEARSALRARDQIAYEIENERQQLSLQIFQLVTEFRSARTDTEAFQLTVSANEQALEGLREGMQAGLWSTRDILEYSERLIRSRLDLEDARRRLWVAQLELEILTGEFVL